MIGIGFVVVSVVLIVMIGDRDCCCWVGWYAMVAMVMDYAQSQDGDCGVGDGDGLGAGWGR